MSRMGERLGREVDRVNEGEGTIMCVDMLEWVVFSFSFVVF